MMKILTIFNKKEREILCQKTREVINFSTPTIQKLIALMQKIMKENAGIGLAANQIGRPWQIFVAEYQNKFYVMINPKIIKHSKKIVLGEEGCLSVPGIIGLVPRYQKIVVEAKDKDNKKIKIKTKNMLARIFQHEIDHLNGVLFIDKAEKLYQINLKKDNAK